MPKYNFYYDESEHSRKINYKTVSASNYYDNFVTMIVGWSAEKDDILQRHAAFETKYADRKDRNGEIKSTMFQQKQFKFGFASLNKQNAQFVNDFLSLFDKDIHIYFSISSKIEYLVLQVFQGYRNSFLVDADLMKYSITKALVMYRPQEIIKCLYESPKDFLEELKKFFRDRIECNKNNPQLKQKETEAFQQILFILDDISDAPEIDWDYHLPFDGFKKYLAEKDISNYNLIIDKEGKEEEKSKTLKAAREIGLDNSDEADSTEYPGLRMADMMAGIISKLLKGLCDSLRYQSLDESANKKILDTGWFCLNEVQLGLYKKLYRLICEWQPAWYKSYSGIYSDDLVVFNALLNFMNHFESVEQIRADIDMLMVDFQNRKREFGLLEAVGATQKQLKAMLSREIGIYLGGSLTVSLVLGTIISIIACQRLEAVNHCITLNLPWLFLIALIAAMVVIYMIFTAYAKAELRKTGILSAIREE